jgi:hypothetical protein
MLYKKDLEQIMRPKVLKTYWFTQGYHPHHFGMVKVIDEIGVIQYRIGKTRGISPQYDAQQIADWGSRINREEVLEFFNEDESKEIKSSPDK